MSYLGFLGATVRALSFSAFQVPDTIIDLQGADAKLRHQVCHLRQNGPTRANDARIKDMAFFMNASNTLSHSL